MPCLEFISPGLTPRQKTRLAAELTHTFEAITGFERDIFGIHFVSYGDGGAAQGGVLWDGTNGRPMVHLILSSPRLPREIKQRIVSDFTAIVKGVAHHPAWSPVIHLHEHPYDNIGVDGELLSDRYPDLRSRRFYYDLADGQVTPP